MNWWRRIKTHARLIALALAGGLLALTFAHPRMALDRPVYRYLFVLDITQSMNTPDYHADKLPPQRLEYAKAAIRLALAGLPCGSEAGLGLFTTQNVQFLFEPLEICEHHAVIDDVLTHIDWRMAWSANTFVEQGLYAALREIGKYDPGIRLAFFTDGQETPPPSARAVFNGKRGEVRGVIVGTGGTQPTVVPRYDRENHFIGLWENADIEAPPVSTTAYEDQRETPAALPKAGSYLSWLDEAHLLELSGITGLRYHRLEDPEALGRTLRDGELAENRVVDTDMRPYLGVAAWMLLVALHWPSLRRKPRARKD